MKVKCNDLETIVSHAIAEMKSECKDDHFSLTSVNISELSRRTGISRSRLRTWKKKGGSFSRKSAVPRHFILWTVFLPFWMVFCPKASVIPSYVWII